MSPPPTGCGWRSWSPPSRWPPRSRWAKTLDCRTSLVFENVDGKAVDIDTCDEDQNAWDEFFG